MTLFIWSTHPSSSPALEINFCVNFKFTMSPVDAMPCTNFRLIDWMPSNETKLTNLSFIVGRFVTYMWSWLSYTGSWEMQLCWLYTRTNIFWSDNILMSSPKSFQMLEKYVILWNCNAIGEHWTQQAQLLLPKILFLPLSVPLTWQLVCAFVCGLHQEMWPPSSSSCLTSGPFDTPEFISLKFLLLLLYIITTY